MAKPSNVDIGFAEKCESWKLQSRLFPSKIGGKPAWLDLHTVPTSEDLQCGMCQQVMTFLCQIYAPYEDDELNFHRTLFVFICRSSTCTNSNMKVLRSSLQRTNDFYSFEPPQEEQDASFSTLKWVKLCNLCGCLAEKHCAKCKLTFYCSRDHQKIDWSVHKNACGGTYSEGNSKFLYSEYELVIEGEVREEHKVDEAAEMLKMLELQGEELPDLTESELDAYSCVAEDKVFYKFKERIKDEPEQVLRYERGGAPLFISNEARPDIQTCQYCGSSRQFEFQVMPQMLTLLKENELDWGVLIVYSCKKSCTEGAGYKEEFIYKQDVSTKGQ